MFGFGKAKVGFGVGRHDETDAYDGTGIWIDCDDCGTPHRYDEPEDFRDALERLCSEIGASSQALYDEFHISDPDGRWDVVPDQARFIFTNADGRQAQARYGVISSWNAESHSWMWGWNFPEDWMPAAAVRVADMTYDHGNIRGWEALTAPLLLVEEHEAWHLTNLAAHVAGFPMVYRAKVNDRNYHYYAIDRPVWMTEHKAV